MFKGKIHDVQGISSYFNFQYHQIAQLICKHFFLYQELTIQVCKGEKLDLVFNSFGKLLNYPAGIPQLPACVIYFYIVISMVVFIHKFCDNEIIKIMKFCIACMFFVNRITIVIIWRKQFIKIIQFHNSTSNIYLNSVKFPNRPNQR